MRYYRYAAVLVLALAAILFGAPTVVAIATPKPQIINTTIIQPPPTASEDSMVKIMVDDGLGSGVHIGNGNILTAAHVVADAKTVKVKTIAGVEAEASVLWVNKDYDIALIHTDGQMFGMSVLDCREPLLGEQIQAAGNPLGIEFVSSFGRVAGKARQMGAWKTVVITDITTVMGQSGGPVFAADGRVIGINVGVSVAPLKNGKGADGEDTYVPSMTGFGFVVPANAVCMLLAREAV
ncbi:S1 family peptidase [Rhizobium rhizogenes]|uniref:S1 family peptidase n=1 Tax=Rhizobium rhizogenes TaxID=359 RepID=UPI001573A081|nr:serine protease [Rhizobium rhizogenes]NTF69358.1 trypsin-like peptidase domain-containing protein [Rhizobium rhizogenes]